MKFPYYKLCVLLLCPATLVFGNLLSFFFPNHLQSLQINKDGWLNSIFVKNGWFWNSIVGWWCILRYGDFQINRQSLIRYSILTIWWYIFTQALWFGIAPIMDLVFTYTGGHCYFTVFDSNGNLADDFHDSIARRLKSLKRILFTLKNITMENDEDLLEKSMSDISCALNEKCFNRTSSPQDINNFIRKTFAQDAPLLGSAQCRSLGGYWIGGHDPSGHVFLITLMIMYSFGELRLFGGKALQRLKKKKYTGLLITSLKLFDNGPIWNLINNKPKNIKSFLMSAFILPPFTVVKDIVKFLGQILKIVVWQNPIILLISLLGMWWWSFLITSIVFHTFTEQLSGLLFAYIVAGIIYWNDHWFIHNAMNQ